MNIEYKVIFPKHGYGGQDGSEYYCTYQSRTFDWLESAKQFIDENELTEYRIYEVTSKLIEG